MSGRNSKSTLQKQKSQNEQIMKDSNNDLTQKIFVSNERSLAKRGDTSPIRRIETSPIRRVNTSSNGNYGTIISSSPDQRLQRQSSDLAAGSLPPTGAQSQSASKKSAAIALSDTK